MLTEIILTLLAVDICLHLATIVVIRKSLRALEPGIHCDRLEQLLSQRKNKEGEMLIRAVREQLMQTRTRRKKSTG